jgi:hypothetical protein
VICSSYPIRKTILSNLFSPSKNSGVFYDNLSKRQHKEVKTPRNVGALMIWSFRQYLADRKYRSVVTIWPGIPEKVSHQYISEFITLKLANGNFLKRFGIEVKQGVKHNSGLGSILLLQTI